MGRWNERDELGAFRMVVEIFGGERVGVDVHMCCPREEMDFSVVVLVALDMEKLEGNS